MDDLLQHLNERQLEAVTHLDGPLLILAGPGSGKTRVVSTRMAYMLQQGVAARRIVGLTFTNKAADEMRHRLRRYPDGDRVWVSTFHRFCSMLLRRYGGLVGLMENFTILDADDSQSVIRRLMSEATTRFSSSPAQIARAISNAKNQLLSPEAFANRAATWQQRAAAEIYPEYQQQLMRTNSVDFDDLLIHVATLLHDNAELRTELDDRYRYVLVDEYQDTNAAQYVIVRAISCDHPNLSVTGDPDQSIYSWRGANIANILSFERDYPDARVVRLEQNYRSTQSILRAADELIVHNRKRKAKRLFTENEIGDPVQIVQYADEKHEAAGIARQIAASIAGGGVSAHEVAILYRTNALSRELEHALRREGLPYQIVQGVEFYQRKEVKDILAYLQLVHNPRNDVAFLRVINVPPRGLGKSSLAKLTQLAQRERLAMMDAARHPAVSHELPKRAARAVQKFAESIAGLRNRMHQPISNLVEAVLLESNYRAHLMDSSHEEDRQRLANVEELISAAQEFQQTLPYATLDDFLEQSSLVGDTDRWDSATEKVTLMTLHAAKGLEFQQIYMIAAEQGIFPHERSREHPDSYEEERRLMFVGITRAKRDLQISYVRLRNYRGATRYTIPSPFLAELSDTVQHRVSQREEIFPPLLQPQPVAARTVTPIPSSTVPSRKRNRSQPDVRIAADVANTDSVAVPEHAHSNTACIATDQVTTTPEDHFEVGMVVRHPDYGLGKLIRLTGKGRTLTGTVQFIHPARRQSFRIPLSPLTPAASTKSVGANMDEPS